MQLKTDQNGKVVAINNQLNKIQNEVINVKKDTKKTRNTKKQGKKGKSKKITRTQVQTDPKLSKVLSVALDTMKM